MLFCIIIHIFVRSREGGDYRLAKESGVFDQRRMPSGGEVTRHDTSLPDIDLNALVRWSLLSKELSGQALGTRRGGLSSKQRTSKENCRCMSSGREAGIDCSDPWSGASPKRFDALITYRPCVCLQAVGVAGQLTRVALAHAMSLVPTTFSVCLRTNWAAAIQVGELARRARSRWMSSQMMSEYQGSLGHDSLALWSRPFLRAANIRGGRKNCTRYLADSFEQEIIHPSRQSS